MPSTPKTWRVTLIWPHYLPIRKNAEGAKVYREVFPNCTGVVNQAGHLSFTDATGKQHMARMLFIADEE